MQHHVTAALYNHWFRQVTPSIINFTKYKSLKRVLFVSRVIKLEYETFFLIIRNFSKLNVTALFFFKKGTILLVRIAWD